MPASSPIVDTTLILHRGASAYAPENTLEALHLAADMGATWIETDVRDTGDARLVMVHDDDVRRTTDGAGRIAQMTLEHIQELDAGGWFSGRYRGARIPTLEDYLETTQERGLGLVLELKDVSGWEDRLTNLVADTVEKVWKANPRKLVISGFSERCLRISKERLPRFPTCLAVTAIPSDPSERLSEAGADMMHLQHSFATPDELAKMKVSGMEFGLATVNNPDRARALLAGGATSILTDKPDLLDARSVEA